MEGQFSLSATRWGRFVRLPTEFCGSTRENLGWLTNRTLYAMLMRRAWQTQSFSAVLPELVRNTRHTVFTNPAEPIIDGPQCASPELSRTKALARPGPCRIFGGLPRSNYSRSTFQPNGPKPVRGWLVKRLKEINRRTRERGAFSRSRH